MRKFILALAAYLVASVAITAIMRAAAEPNLLTESRKAMWRLRPGFSGPSAPAPGSGHATIDERGFRLMPDGFAGDGRTMILTAGDSFTFGWGVDDASTYPSQLQSLLENHAPGRYAVTNVGFPGCTSYQARQLMGEWLNKLSPDVIVLLIGRNDGRRATLSDSDSHRYLRFKPEFLSWVVPFAVVTYDNLQRMARQAGVAPSNRVSPEEYKTNLTSIIEQANDAGVEVILMDHWTKPDWRPGVLLPNLGQGSIPCPKLLRQAAERRGKSLFIEAHHHPDREGYSIIAAALTDEFARRHSWAEPQLLQAALETTGDQSDESASPAIKQ